MSNPKYKVRDRIRPIKESYIYIIDDYYEDEDGDIVYVVHANTKSQKTKEVKEKDVVFAGYTFY